jgi:hypothetical protein
LDTRRTRDRRLDRTVAILWMLKDIPRPLQPDWTGITAHGCIPMRHSKENKNMLLKSSDDKTPFIHELERLWAVAPVDRQPGIKQEMKCMMSGSKGERESAYLIDFHFKDSKNYTVIHDLRLEIGNRVAQIDHLLINRRLEVFVLESKNSHAGIKVTEEGEFLRWNDFKKTYEGMASPFAQNERHITVLKDAFAQIDMPTRMGMRLSPVFHSYVLVAPNVRVDRPKKFDTSKLIKADEFMKTLDKQIDKIGFLDAVGSLARVVSSETLADIGRKLVALHQSASFDYAARFGIAEPIEPRQKHETATVRPETPHSLAESNKPSCRSCGSGQVSIQHGKYGYYFKCSACDGNTPVKIGCGKEGHKERLRKEGRNFHRECADCGTSALYFTNPA